MKLDTSKLRMKQYFKKFDSEGIKAMEKVGIYAIDNMANGSGRLNLAPPILTSRLRGSGSVFVNGVFVYDTSSKYTAGTPAKTGAESKKWTVTLAFNTPYAARWHEEPFNPGPISRIYGNTGNKYVERHLEKDNQEYMEIFSRHQRDNVK